MNGQNSPIIPPSHILSNTNQPIITPLNQETNQRFSPSTPLPNYNPEVYVQENFNNQLTPQPPNSELSNQNLDPSIQTITPSSELKYQPLLTVGTEAYNGANIGFKAMTTQGPHFNVNPTLISNNGNQEQGYNGANDGFQKQLERPIAQPLDFQSSQQYFDTNPNQQTIINSENQPFMLSDSQTGNYYPERTNTRGANQNQVTTQSKNSVPGFANQGNFHETSTYFNENVGNANLNDPRYNTQEPNVGIGVTVSTTLFIYLFIRLKSMANTILC
uniref:Uncharacterized protein n=1 Tax=Heterorhabditis bacteriophora TaxID=37862 RepID=A0A1I7WT69_HETBA